MSNKFISWGIKPGVSVKITKVFEIPISRKRNFTEVILLKRVAKDIEKCIGGRLVIT